MTDQRPLAVFDIDGVLADVRHRLHHVESRPKNWDAFFDAAGDDPPLPEGVALCLASAHDCEVVYVTGRPERCRQATLDWFGRHGLPTGRLSMRRQHDRRPARVAKPQLLQSLAGDRVVAVVVDDDAAVCAGYESLGWPVLRATWMSPAATAHTLWQAQERDGRT